MMEYNLGVSIENTYEIKRFDMDYFDDEIFKVNVSRWMFDEYY